MNWLRVVLVSIFAALLATDLTCLAATEVEKKRPNILLLAVDDMND